MILLDANLVSELIRPAPSPAVVDWLARRPTVELFISAITLGEIDFRARIHQQARRRAELLAWCDQLQTVMFQNRVLPFDADCARP